MVGTPSSWNLKNFFFFLEHALWYIMKGFFFKRSTIGLALDTSGEHSCGWFVFPSDKGPLPDSLTLYTIPRRVISVLYYFFYTFISPTSLFPSTYLMRWPFSSQITISLGIDPLRNRGPLYSVVVPGDGSGLGGAKVFGTTNIHPQ